MNRLKSQVVRETVERRRPDRAGWRSARALAVSALFLPAWGCGEQGIHPETVPVAQVPPAIMKTAVKSLPNVKFDLARKFKVGDQDAFEIRGKDPRGKIREVEISASGDVLEIE